jgi:hypothetical protein
MLGAELSFYLAATVIKLCDYLGPMIICTTGPVKNKEKTVAVLFTQHP